MKILLIITFSFLIATKGSAQGTLATFIDYQKGFSRPGDALRRKEDTLQKQFATKGLAWPAKYVYIRSFKYDGELEIWVKNERNDPYQLFKTYKVCALAGTLGPKRIQGDYQVPEGFYYINEFNPNSNYYLSLGLNYPNASDRILSDSMNPGGNIYIHGSCVTVGCIPVTDKQIDEIYILAAYAKNNGQDFIPVHIYPIRYDNKKSAAYLANLAKSDAQLKVFAENLENVYDHFEATRQLPVIMTNAKGDYVYEDLVKRKVDTVAAVVPVKVKKAPVQHRYRTFTSVPEVVTQWPKFLGHGEDFLEYLKRTGKTLVESLPEGRKRVNVVVEFIVDVDGMATNFKVLNGVNAEFDEELISALEQMPQWIPALIDNKWVPKKMKQSFVIE